MGRHAGRTWGSWRNFFPRSFVAVVFRPNALGSLVVVSIGSTRTGCNRPPFRGGELTVTLFTSPPAVGIVVIVVLTVSDGSSILLDLFLFVGVMRVQTFVAVFTLS